MMNISRPAHLLCEILRFDTRECLSFGTLTPADWQQILSLAVAQNLAPLVYFRVRNLDITTSIPDDVLSALQKNYLQNVVDSLITIHQFDNLQAEFTSGNISIIPLKGIFLALQVYSNPALRQMRDIDILIHPKDVAGAVKILESLGYRPIRPYDLRSEFKFHRHLPAFIKHGALPIEIHNSLQQPTDPFYIDLDPLWQRIHISKIREWEINCLNHYDLLLYLCINVAYHDLFRLGLRGLYDLSAVIEHYKARLDWDQFYDRCRAWRTERLVFITLSMAQDLLGAKVPGEFLSSLLPANFDEEIFSISREFLFAEPAVFHSVTPELDQLVQNANLFVKLRILLNRLFIPRNEISYYYDVPPGSWKIYLCYPQRLKYLFKRYFPIGIHLHQQNSYLLAVSEEMRNQDVRRKYLEKNLI